MNDEQVIDLLREIAEQDGEGDYLEMGIQCIYCSWHGGHGQEPIHDKSCVIVRIKSLLSAAQSAKTSKG